MLDANDNNDDIDKYDKPTESWMPMTITMPKMIKQLNAGFQ